MELVLTHMLHAAKAADGNPKGMGTPLLACSQAKALSINFSTDFLSVANPRAMSSCGVQAVVDHPCMVARMQHIMIESMNQMLEVQLAIMPPLRHQQKLCAAGRNTAETQVHQKLMHEIDCIPAEAPAGSRIGPYTAACA